MCLDVHMIHGLVFLGLEFIGFGSGSGCRAL